MKIKSVTALVVLFAFALSQFCYAQANLDAAASAFYQRVHDEALRRGVLITSGTDYDRIQHITQRLIAVAPEMRGDAASWAWEVVYIRSPVVNAMCLPGGKMIVLSSLVDRLALSDDEIAAVMGHEMAHALLEHGREAYQQRQVANVAVGILGIIAAIAGAKHHTDPNLAFNASTAVGTLGAEFLALRPYSRERELAADKYGAELAARAGFDPQGAIGLQRKMAGFGSSIEFLSTHPVSETRVAQLSEAVPMLTQRFAARREPQTIVAKATSTRVPPASSSAPSAVRTPDSAISGVQQTVVQIPMESAGHALVEQARATASSAIDPDAISGPAAAGMTSKYMFSAERYAKSNGCALPAATMTVRASTYESFDIQCSDGTRLRVRCDGGNCSTP